MISNTLLIGDWPKSLAGSRIWLKLAKFLTLLKPLFCFCHQITVDLKERVFHQMCGLFDEGNENSLVCSIEPKVVRKEWELHLSQKKADQSRWSCREYLLTSAKKVVEERIDVEKSTRDKTHTFAQIILHQGRNYCLFNISGGEYFLLTQKVTSERFNSLSEEKRKYTPPEMVTQHLRLLTHANMWYW